ncbi:thiol-disulfide oxidoreductase DCC family protein [Dyadobacter jejuensis]|nr:DCC1-like thiol-disulfide oxidoreductase family protein [Dyadobacter jejuensis]
MKPQHIVFYDGDCALCNRFVLQLLKWDRREKLYFCSLQSDYGQQTLREHGRSLSDFDTFLYLHEGRLTEKSTGVLDLLYDLGGRWRWVSGMRILPKVLRDLVYDWVARNRHHVIGSNNSCKLPKPEWKRRFI